MSEFIGSRISLISKSDIRYVGTLKAIDSDSATVSLERVQCMGSEGRKEDPSQEVAANDLIYDGIVFRGSDVKDLSILSAPTQIQQLDDPAIVQQQQLPPAPPPQQQQQQQQPQQQHNHQPPPPPHQQHDHHFRGPQYPPQYQQQQGPYGYGPGPPQNQFQQPPRFGGPGGAHGFPGTPGAVPGYGMPPPGYGMDPRFGPPGQNFPPGPYPPQMPIGPPGQHNMQQRPQQMSAPSQAPVGSKEPTPQPISAQAPPPPQKPPVEMSTTPAASSGIPPPPPIESKPSVASATAPAAGAPSQKPSNARTAQSKANSRVAVPLPPSAAAKSQQRSAAPPQAQGTAPAAATQSAPVNSTEAATAAVAAAMAKLASLNQTGDGYDNLASKVNQMRVQDGQPRGRGGRARGPPRERGGRRDGPPKAVEVPKEDFDFESANAKFNKQELVKEAIATGSPISSPQEGVIADPIASIPNGHAGAVEDVVIPAKPATEKGYDKKSSFFDNISSDLRDRTEQLQSFEQIDGRAMRRDERSKNVETFGQGSVDGGFRGRGRGRGRGGSSRGGGRGFYGAGGPRGGGPRSDRGRGQAVPLA